MNNLRATVRQFWVLLLVASGLVATEPAFAQSASVGFDPTSTFHRYRIDDVNLLNGNAVIKIPLVSYSQRDQRMVSLSFYANTNYWEDEFYCQPSGTQSFCTHQYLLPGQIGLNPFTINIPAAGIYWDQQISANWKDRMANYCYTVKAENNEVQYEACGTEWFRDVYLTDASGATHPLLTESGVPNTMRTTDGTGYLVKFDQSDPNQPFTQMNPLSIVGPDGKDMSTNAKDSNGNSYYTLSSGSNGSVLTDSVGRQIPLTPTAASNTSGCPNLSLPNQPVIAAATLGLPGPNGGILNYLLCYAAVNIHTNFWNLGGVTYSTSNVGCGTGNDADNCTYETLREAVTSEPLLQSLVLPDGTSYQFEYDSADPNNSAAIAYGEMKKITYPTGGSVSYTYSIVSLCGNQDFNQNATLRYINTRKEDDGEGTTYLWKYSLNGGGITTVTDPNLNDTVYTFEAAPLNNQNCPLIEQNRKIYQGPKSANMVLQTIASSYDFRNGPEPSHAPADYAFSIPLSNALLNARTTTTGTAVVTETFAYDPLFQANSTGTSVPLSLGIPSGHSTSGDGASISTRSTYDWWTNGSQSRQANLLLFPSSIITHNSDNTVASETDFKYDESAYSAYGDNKGRLTTTKKLNSAGSDIVTRTLWNAQGTVSGKIDGKHQTAASYGYSSTYHGLYPTSVSDALYTNTYTFDLNTGALLSKTDPDQQTTSTRYDNTGRQWYVQNPDLGSSSGASVVACYPDNKTVFIYTAQDVAIPIPTNSTLCPTVAGNTRVLKTIYDGLGRVVETLASTASGAQIYERVKLDGYDRVLQSWNPSYCNPASTSSCSESTFGITSWTYDALGRKTLQCQPGSVSSSTYGCTPSRSWQYDGNITTYRDENYHTWVRTSDALGRLVKVAEPKGTQSIYTTYSYDTLGDLRCADQWGTLTPGSSCSSNRARSFSYNSLSQLLCASNPESGSSSCPVDISALSSANGVTTYVYDANGNLTSKASPLANSTSNLSTQTINYGYDSLDRLTSKTSPMLPATSPAKYMLSCWLYRGATTPTSANLIGRLTDSWTQAVFSASSCPSTPPSGLLSRLSVLAYDPMGRALDEQQCTIANCSSTGYTLHRLYDLSGNEKSKSSGISAGVGSFVFSSNYDGFGRLTSISSNNTLFPTSVFSVPAISAAAGCNSSSPVAGYSAAGGLQNATLGTGLQIYRGYDQRLRPNCEVDSGNSAPNPTPGTASITITGIDQTH